MIRVGNSSTGVLSKFNSFHNTTQTSTGFYTNSDGGSLPPSYVKNVFGTQYASPPYARDGGTFYVDPYGFTQTVPFVVANFYLQVQIENSSFRIFSGNNYSGTLSTLLDYTSVVTNNYSASQGSLVYLRLNNATPARAYRLFLAIAGNTSKDGYVVLVGPENIGKVVNFPSGGFDLGGLVGILCARVSFDRTADPVVAISAGQVVLSSAVGAFSESNLGSLDFLGTSDIGSVMFAYFFK